jgi:MFS family permease
MAVRIEEAKTGALAAKPVGGMFRALSHRNFRLFWAGAFLSNVGTWMQAVAQGWLVLQLTDSPFWLGVDGFMATAPGLLLTLAGGVFADLIDRRRILLYTQIGAGLSAFTLAMLVWAQVVSDASHVWIILLLTFWTGCCMALAGPSYQAITIDMVGREDLANAIALNSTQFQLSRVMGPVFAGFALRWLGLAGCFFANGLSYIAVVVALVMVQFDDAAGHRPAHAVGDRHAFWQDLIEGLRYVRRRPRVFMLLMISAVTSLFGAPYLSMVPLFARDILHLNEGGLALMMGLAGAGAFVGALFVTFLGDFRYKGWFVLGGAWAFGLFLVGFSFSTRLYVSLAYLFGMGLAIVCSIAVTNTLLQKLVTDEMRGRVMSMFILSFIGAMPIGNLLAGSGAERFGAPRTLAAGGLIITLYVTYVTIRNKRLRVLH